MKFRSVALIAALLAAVPVAAFAQGAGPVNTFLPTGNATLSVSSTSSSVALPTNAASTPIASQSALITNTGSQTAFVIFGNSSVVATVYGFPIPVGASVGLNINNNTYIAAITSTSTTTLAITTGAGTPSIAYAPGAVSGTLDVQGTGTAGSPAGGVLTIQGASGGTAVPITGSVSATNPSVSATGSPVPADATYAGMNVSGNLVGLTGTSNGLKVDGSGVTQPVSGTVTATQATAGNLNATVVGTGTFAVQDSTTETNTGTVAGAVTSNVMQGNVKQWDGTALGAPSNYGTSPGAVAVPGVNAYVTNTPSVVQPDVRSTDQTINSAVSNAAYTVNVNDGEGAVGFSISGLTASGATLTPECSNNIGAVTPAWAGCIAVGGSTLYTTVTADGSYRIESGGRTAVRFRVSTTGTGSIDFSSSASSVGSLVTLGQMIPAGSNTIGAVTQASGPWTSNVTEWAGTALGAVSNYGTSPGAVAVPGFNAYVTNSPAVTNAGTFAVQDSTTETNTGTTATNTGTTATNTGTTATNTGTIAGAVSSSVMQDNIKQVNGVTTLTGAGATGTGSQRNTVAQDQTTIAGATPGRTYNTIAASQTAQALTGGSGGATGDYLSHCVVIPTSTSPGVVTIYDNSTTVYAFPGGSSSLSNLVPFTIPVGAVSVSGAWKITTGASLSVVCVGKFT